MEDKHSTETNRIMQAYGAYLEDVRASILHQIKALERLYAMMASAGAIHCYGFGRSGSAALSLAIRLRHFCEKLPPVWWIGDQVRMPIREGDVVILFSSSGKRAEVEEVAKKAHDLNATVVLVTSHRNVQIGGHAKEKIILPVLDQPFVYGGGDFELAAYLLQEIVVADIGMRNNIPKDAVDRYHV